MICAETEKVFPLTEAHKHAAELTGRPYHQSSMFRWANKGIGGIRLETRRMGGARFTSREAINRFFDALSVAAEQSDA